MTGKRKVDFYPGIEESCSLSPLRRVALYLLWCISLVYVFIDSIPSQALRLYHVRIASIFLAQKNWDWLDFMWYHPKKAPYALVSVYCSARRYRNICRKITYKLLAKTAWKTVETQRLDI